jgi:hypothetical protein
VSRNNVRRYEACLAAGGQHFDHLQWNNSRGKTISTFLENASLLYHKAPVTAAMLRGTVVYCVCYSKNLKFHQFTILLDMNHNWDLHKTAISILSHNLIFELLISCFHTTFNYWSFKNTLINIKNQY